MWEGQGLLNAQAERRARLCLALPYPRAGLGAVTALSAAWSGAARTRRAGPGQPALSVQLIAEMTTKLTFVVLRQAAPGCAPLDPCPL